MVSATGDHRTEVLVRLASAGTDRHSGPMPSEGEALLVTGIYGSGKTSLVEELADHYERIGMDFGAIDLDWLGWYRLPEDDGVTTRPDLQQENLSNVAGRYWRSGVRHLLIAGAAKDDADVERIRAALPCPLRVVLLTTPLAVVERRLSAIPTSGRAHDLEVAKGWVARGLGQCSADLTLPGDAPLASSAAQVASWLDWPRVT